MTINIVVFDPPVLNQQLGSTILEGTSDVEVVFPERLELAAALSDAEVFFGFHPPEIFREAKKLRWIQFTAAGLDQLLDAELVERGLLITNASGVHAPQVVETAWALTMALARRLPKYLRNQKDHRWEPDSHYDLAGSTVGIVGLGGIGRRYARIAAAFGMRVKAVDPHRSTPVDGVESVWGMNRLDELLQQADVVLISCPYTQETQHLIDRGRLRMMKRTAILVNIARGGIVEEEALMEALRAGQIAGAGLDVCETEPLPAESPLWDVPNLIITPHCAGLSTQRADRLTQFFCQNLSRYVDGKPLVNLIDPQRGYPVSSG